ncbi:MAG: protoporphyrinogen oxidase, partial [Gemmatimonadota bacterium]
MTRTDVAIVGAGLSGLALDRELHRRGVDTLVLEADGRPGGVVRSLRVDGRVLDAGPQRTRLVPEVESLVEDLGLGERVVTAPRGLPLFVYRDGRLRRVPFTIPEFVTTDLLSVRGKLRAVAEPLLPAARKRPSPGESVAAYLTRRLGREACLHLVGPLYGGIYASDPAEMPVEHSLGPALERLGAADGSLVVAAARRMLSGKEAPPAATFTDGMAELTDALADRAGDRLRLSCPATGLR